MVYTIGSGATPSFPSIGSGATPSSSTSKIGSGAKPTFSAPTASRSTPSNKSVAINIGSNSTGHRHHHHHSSSTVSSSSNTKCTSLHIIGWTVVFIIFIVFVVMCIIDPSQENKDAVGNFLDSIFNN